MHAITAMARELRKGPRKYGLVLANGGSVTHQHVVCLSNRARRDGSEYPREAPLPERIYDLFPYVETTIQGEEEAVIEVFPLQVLS
jgi:hypothetical protein